MSDKTRWVYAFSEGDGGNKLLLGGKGANLCEMTRIGLPVPPGFVVTTDACLAYLKEGRLPDGLMDEVRALMARGYGDPLPSNTATLDFSRCIVGHRHKLIYNATWQMPYWPVDFFGQPFWLELVKQNEAGTLDPKWRSLYFAPQRPMFELYDLRENPAEMKNLADKPELAAIEGELKDALQEWMILEQDYIPLPGGRKPK